METVLAALTIYFVLMVVFRISGKRAMSQMTTFDLILLLIISEATQQALLGDDFSIATAVTAILTLVTADVGMGWLSRRYATIEKLTESVPVVLMREGVLFRDRMQKQGVTESMIREQARSRQGLESLEQVKDVVLETSGGISIIPYRGTH